MLHQAGAARFPGRAGRAMEFSAQAGRAYIWNISHHV